MKKVIVAQGGDWPWSCTPCGLTALSTARHALDKKGTRLAICSIDRCYAISLRARKKFPSFSGLFIRFEIGHMHISSAGKGRITSRGSGEGPRIDA